MREKSARAAGRRFYAPPESFHGGLVVLDSAESHHLLKVVRLGVGDRVVVCDGRGREVEAVVESCDPGAILKVAQELNAGGESPLALTLGVGLAKGEAMDVAIRQATELGVKRILPFISTRSEISSPERAARRLARWQRLAQESLKCCQRSCLPEIFPPQDFAAVLAGPEEARFIFWEEERRGGLSAALKKPAPAGVRLLIGPEGGFTAAEAALARQAGYQVLSLGPRRLRVETAVLTALALVQYTWGDLA